MPEMPSRGIVIKQCLFGYNDGHRLLASSHDLPQSTVSTLLPFSDLIPTIADRSQSYWTGFPIPSAKQFALMKTWPAPEMPRPGCVWTHVLLIDFQDIAHFDDLAILAHHVRRPDPKIAHSVYSDHLVIAPQRTLSPTYATIEIVPVLRAIYGSRPHALNGSKSLPDPLLFALWSQQWPRLRRSFTFQTAALASTDSGTKFDLRVSSFPSRDSDDSPIQAWEEEAAIDANQQQLSDFRRFLWRYGSDLKSGRARFATLAEIYCSFIRSGEATAAPIAISKVFNTFTDVNDAITLKQDVLGTTESQWSMFEQPDPLAVMRLLIDHPTMMPQIGLTEKQLSAVKASWSHRASECLEIADSALEHPSERAELYLQIIASAAEPSGFLKRAKNFPNALAALVRRRPELLDSPDLDDLPDMELAKILGEIKKDPGLVLKLVPRLAGRELGDVADKMFRSSPAKVSELLITEILAGTSVSQCWTHQLSRLPIETLVKRVLKQASSEADLARGLSMVRWDVKGLSSIPHQVWAHAIAKLKPEDYDTESQWLRCFLLAIALERPASGVEPIFEYSFEAVHEGMAKSRLPYGAFNLVSPYLADVYFWQHWDTCLRLRISVANAYLEARLEKESFLKLAGSKRLKAELIDQMSYSKAGRKYLKN